MNRVVIRNIVWAVAIIALIIFLRGQFVDVNNVMITVNVPGNSTEEQVEEVLGVFAERNARGTFFVPGGWAVVHPELVLRIAAEHELACYTYTGARLTANTNDSEITKCKEEFEALTGKPVYGFRAPSNDVGSKTYGLIAEHYAYDSSVFGRYGWFWEEYPEDFVEVPVTSVLLWPLDDWFAFYPDLWYWFAKQAQQEPVVVAVTVGEVNEQLLNLEFLIAHYQQDSNVTTIAEWLDGQ